MPQARPVRLEKDFVAIGRRFACCTNMSGSMKDLNLEKVAWKTGIVRSATEVDIDSEDQQFCVEWDGKDPVRDYEWIYLYDTPAEDRCENVKGGNFACFLIEDRLMWCDTVATANGTSNGAKSAKSAMTKVFRPVASFFPLLDHVHYNDKDRLPIYVLGEQTLAFVDKDQIGAVPVQQHQTSLTMKGSSSPVQKDMQIAINHWFDSRRNLQRLIHDKDRHLIGQSVQVYWKDGANQRWYNACMKAFNKDSTVTVMDYNVMQDRRVDPRLEEIRIVKDYGRSSAITSTSPTPSETFNTPTRGRSRRPVKAEPQESVKIERSQKSASAKVRKEKNVSPSPRDKKSKATVSAGMTKKKAQAKAGGTKRPRGRPAGNKKAAAGKRGRPKRQSKKQKIPSSTSEEEEQDDEDEESDEGGEEEEPVSQASRPQSDSESEEEQSWALEKLLHKKKNKVTPRVAPAPPSAALPVKRKAKSPSPLPQKRAAVKKVIEDSVDSEDEQDEDDDDSSSHSVASAIEDLEESSSSEQEAIGSSESEDFVERKSGQRTSSRNTQVKTTGKKREPVKEETSPGRHLPSRMRRQPFSYKEPSDEEVEVGDTVTLAVPKPIPFVVAKPLLVERVPEKVVVEPKIEIAPELPVADVKKIKQRKAPRKSVLLNQKPVMPAVSLMSPEEVPVKEVESAKAAANKTDKVVTVEKMESLLLPVEKERSPHHSTDNSTIKTALKAALAAPPVGTVGTASHLPSSSSWQPQLPKTSTAAIPSSTQSDVGAPKKMARVAGQPQGPPTEYAREPPEALHRQDVTSSFHHHQHPRSTDRVSALPHGSSFSVASAVVAPSPVQQQQSEHVLPPNPQAHEYYQQHQMRYQQSGPYPSQYSYPPQAVPPVPIPVAVPVVVTSQPQQSQQRQHQQHHHSSSSAASASPFRATTPSPFVPRNSPVSNPQQQQQTTSHSQSAQQQNHQQQQSAYRTYGNPQLPQQQQYAGSMIPGYGATPAFYYPSHMGSGQGFAASAPTAIMYGNPNASAGVPMGMPMYCLPGQDWSQTNPMMYGTMTPGMPHVRIAQDEHYARMAAAAAAAQAASTRASAAVRSTATSPDLRPSSNNPLTGVITGAMQALNNFQIPSPPLVSSPFPSMMYGGNAKHSTSASPTPANSSVSRQLAEGHYRDSPKEAHRQQPISHSVPTEKVSRTPEPYLPVPSPSISYRSNVSGSIGSTAEGKDAKGKSSKSSSPKQSPKSKTCAPNQLIGQPNFDQTRYVQSIMSQAGVQGPPSRLPPVEHAPNQARGRNEKAPESVPLEATTSPSKKKKRSPNRKAEEMPKLNESVAGEPCPLTMLSAIATSMMPVDTEVPIVVPVVHREEVDVGAKNLNEPVVSTPIVAEKEIAVPMPDTEPERQIPIVTEVVKQSITLQQLDSSPLFRTEVVTETVTETNLPHSSGSVQMDVTISSHPFQPTISKIPSSPNVGIFSPAENLAPLLESSVHVEVAAIVTTTPPTEPHQEEVIAPRNTASQPIVSYPNSDEEDEPRLMICEEQGSPKSNLSVESACKKSPVVAAGSPVHDLSHAVGETSVEPTGTSFCSAVLPSTPTVACVESPGLCFITDTQTDTGASDHDQPVQQVETSAPGKSG